MKTFPVKFKPRVLLRPKQPERYMPPVRKKPEFTPPGLISSIWANYDTKNFDVASDTHGAPFRRVYFERPKQREKD